MFLESFFTVLSLRVGIVIVGTVFFVLALVIFEINLFDFHSDSQNALTNPSSFIPIVIIVIFVVCLLVICVLMVKAAYDESRKLCFITMGCIATLAVVWLTLCCLSFLNKENILRRICNIDRCPETLWISLLHYRGEWRTVDEENVGRFLGPKDYEDVYEDDGEEHILKDIHRQVVDESVLSREADTYFSFGFYFIMAIVMFIVHAACFAYSFVLVWSYSEELKNRKRI